MIPQEYIYELTRRSDVVDIIGANVQLRRRGRTYTGLCPFHNEKTPSFVVYPETQSFYCFGCGEGGDVIGFVRKINNLDYVEAVKQLASRAGIPLPDEDDTQGKLRAKLININKDAARFFYEKMNEDIGIEARKYWRGRGLSDATIRRFGLGFAQDSFYAMCNFLKSKGYSEEEVLASGLVKKSEKGNLYDVFRNRVMIPIFDLRGNVIAFGGRNLGNEKPKYINSPETLLYKKSRAMFALNIAKKSDNRKYILCEGYMDVIAMHQAGFTTAVAACGTALTQEQVKLLSDYADELVLCYDSDEAGQKATQRSLGLLENSPIKVSILSIPDAKDPDEFIKRYGRERFEMLLNGSSNAVEYELIRAKTKYDIKTQDGRVSYLREAINILAGRLSPTQRDVYAGRLAEETDTGKPAILAQISAAVKQKERKNVKERERKILEQGAGAKIKMPYSQGSDKLRGVYFAEQQLMCAILKNPDLIVIVREKLGQTEFLSAEMGETYAEILKLVSNGHSVELVSLSSVLPNETIVLLSRILAENYDVPLSQKDVEIYIDRIKNAVPIAANAAQKSPQELAEEMRILKEKKI